ncbi:DUF892 family protein [Halomarina ordinaria]|uniref:DUF892 family protein n=1 Tax=Halomarina ordinaria TaxID=3033939 RepID=A0ABD5U8R7_9EURY|nr:DUF892 family protein [Halomarina sp. PSRA2]
MFDRELQKLYHAEVEILDLHADLAAAAASEEITAIFEGHREDTVEQVHRIERVFDVLGQDPRERGSALMEGLLAEKDEFVDEVVDDDLRDLDVIGVGSLNERIEITLLDRLLVLAADLDLPAAVAEALAENRAEAQSALDRMQSILDERRPSDGN